MTETKRGNKDHEGPMLHDLKEILENIFDLKGFDKHTISRGDITYDSFITIDRLKPKLKGYEFFDFLFDKKVLIVEVKTPGEPFGLKVMAQVEDIHASYLRDLDRKEELKDEKIDKIIVLTVVTSVNQTFMRHCQERGITLKSVEGKKGLYLLPRLIPIYIIVIEELAFDAVYVQLLKYIKNLKRLTLLISRMKEGMKREKFIKILTSFVEYNPKIAADRRIKEMLPVLTEKKDRVKYINSLVEAFGNKEVLETFETKERLEGLTSKERLEGLPPKEVLKNLNLENLSSEDIKSLSKKNRDALKKMLSDN